jgi:hypothetical protein
VWLAEWFLLFQSSVLPFSVGVENEGNVPLVKAGEELCVCVWGGGGFRKAHHFTETPRIGGTHITKSDHSGKLKLVPFSDVEKIHIENFCFAGRNK